MEISGFDKIKVNNAVIVCLIVITCAFLPLTTLLLIDYRFFFQLDLIKILLATVSVGCTQFIVFYSANSLSMRIKHYKKDEHLDETKVSFLLRHPLINTISILVLLYGTLMIMIHMFHLDIKQTVNYLVLTNTGLILSMILDLIVFWRKK